MEHVLEHHAENLKGVIDQLKGMADSEDLPNYLADAIAIVLPTLETALGLIELALETREEIAFDLDQLEVDDEHDEEFDFLIGEEQFIPEDDAWDNIESESEPDVEE